MKPKHVVTLLGFIALLALGGVAVSRAAPWVSGETTGCEASPEVFFARSSGNAARAQELLARCDARQSSLLRQSLLWGTATVATLLLLIFWRRSRFYSRPPDRLHGVQPPYNYW